MKLQFTAEEEAFRLEVREFVRQHLPADIKRKVELGLRLEHQDYVTWFRILEARGWLTPSWPKEHGGPGWTHVQKYIFDEETLLGGAPRIIASGIQMLGPVLLAFGTEAQKRQYLPDIRQSNTWWAQGFSEPGAGSDLAAVRTTAVLEPDGKHFVVNGHKVWTSYAHWCSMMFALVRTDPNASKPQEGISFLLIDMKSPGVTVRPILTLDGEHEVNEVWFDDVEVPVDQLVGPENQGWTCAKYLLAHERTNIADVNRAKRELERLKRIARAEGLWEDTRFRDQIALLEVDIVALEMMVLRVLSAERGGKKSLDVAGLLKIRGSEIQQRYTELMMLAGGPYSLPFIFEAMEAGWQGDAALGGVWPGGDAHAHCIPLTSTYLNYRKTTIYGGSNEVQRNIVAQTLLG